MNKILVIGAGLSSYYLIDYLAKNALIYDWQVKVADTSLNQVKEKTKNYPHLEALELDILASESAEKIISQVDIVVSLVPAFLQGKVAEYCLKLRKHLLTASYLPPEIKAMEAEVKKHNLLFINELGLDPGIDHLSAMQIIDHLKAQGANITAFRSFCGALIAPESDNNPWHYKFTWNPRNVVLAGQGIPAKYKENGKYRYIPYNQLFKQIQSIQIEGYGAFEAYANRDSLSYRQVYGLEEVPTILRGTLRKAGYCEAWDILIQLGLTEDGFTIEDSENMTYREFIESFLAENQGTLIERIAQQTGKNINSEALQKILWLGLLEEKKIGLANATPAQILQNLLAEKWQLESADKDMIVMQHLIDYQLDNKNNRLISEMVVIGENAEHTAIAKTVGLPLAIATKLILLKKNQLFGVFIPTSAELYTPILAELNELGIQFKEKTIEI